MIRLIAIALVFLLSACAQNHCMTAIDTYNNCASSIQFNLKNYTNLDSRRSISIIVMPQEKARVGLIDGFDCEIESSLLDNYEMQLIIGNKSISLDRSNITSRLTKDTERSTRSHYVWLLDTKDFCQQLGATSQ